MPDAVQHFNLSGSDSPTPVYQGNIDTVPRIVLAAHRVTHGITFSTMARISCASRSSQACRTIWKDLDLSHEGQSAPTPYGERGRDRAYRRRVTGKIEGDPQDRGQDELSSQLPFLAHNDCLGEQQYLPLGMVHVDADPLPDVPPLFLQQRGCLYSLGFLFAMGAVLLTGYFSDRIMRRAPFGCFGSLLAGIMTFVGGYLIANPCWALLALIIGICLPAAGSYHGPESPHERHTGGYHGARYRLLFRNGRLARHSRPYPSRLPHTGFRFRGGRALCCPGLDHFRAVHAAPREEGVLSVSPIFASG